MLRIKPIAIGAQGGLRILRSVSGNAEQTVLSLFDEKTNESEESREWLYLSRNSGELKSLNP